MSDEVVLILCPVLRSNRDQSRHYAILKHKVKHITVDYSIMLLDSVSQDAADHMIHATDQCDQRPAALKVDNLINGLISEEEAI